VGLVGGLLCFRDTMRVQQSGLARKMLCRIGKGILLLVLIARSAMFLIFALMRCIS